VAGDSPQGAIDKWGTNTFFFDNIDLCFLTTVNHSCIVIRKGGGRKIVQFSYRAPTYGLPQPNS
jgi:hypothetical protein